MSKKLLRFSRSHWETAVAYEGSDPLVVRDYDILKDREKGLSCGQLAIKYGITCQAIMKIINKYH